MISNHWRRFTIKNTEEKHTQKSMPINAVEDPIVARNATVYLPWKPVAPLGKNSPCANLLKKIIPE